MKILGMLPSEIERLKKAGPTEKLKADLLSAIERVLAKPTSRDETIFLAAKNLSKAGIERLLTPLELASSITDLAFQSTKDFLSGLNNAYAGRVALAAIQNSIGLDHHVPMTGSQWLAHPTGGHVWHLDYDTTLAGRFKPKISVIPEPDVPSRYTVTKPVVFHGSDEGVSIELLPWMIPHK